VGDSVRASGSVVIRGIDTTRSRTNHVTIIGDNKTIVNGVDYTDRIPKGASISVVGGKVYANGILVE
jgi:hypothetical protein